MRIILWLILAAVLSPACKPKQNAALQPLPSADEVNAQASEVNNLVISFYSKGEGANAKAVETIENFLQEYSLKINLKIPYSKMAWGREGEVDFCIFLSDLKGEEKGMFVSKIRALTNDFELIHFYENRPCRELK